MMFNDYKELAGLKGTQEIATVVTQWANVMATEHVSNKKQFLWMAW